MFTCGLKKYWRSFVVVYSYFIIVFLHIIYMYVCVPSLFENELCLAHKELVFIMDSFPFSVRPTIQFSTSSVIGLLDGDITLSCPASGQPTPTKQWLLPDGSPAASSQVRTSLGEVGRLHPCVYLYLYGCIYPTELLSLVC